MTRGSTTWNFTYDANGMRIKRSSGSSIYNYAYHGDQLTHMTYGNNELHFYYDASGRPLSVTYNGATYYYVLNLQGDVVAILDSNGTKVVGYSYDAWGRPLTRTGSMASTLGLHNPLRYRGYVYDQESGLYYLQSRYYNPEIGRFINADSLDYLGADGSPVSYNLFVYCMNNPVMGCDSTGHWDWDLFGKVLVTTVIVAACLTGVGAIAAMAATAAATSVATAVTVSVATASLSTVLGAVDGAICAQQNGGKRYDGAMAGAIGGSAGAFVSSLTSPLPGTDSALRMNTTGRVVSSLLYDVSYDLFSSGQITGENLALYTADITMDFSMSTIYYYYAGGIPNGYLRATMFGIADGIADVLQTMLFNN